MPRSPFSRTEVWVTLLAFAAFLPSLSGAFVFDDPLLITDNAYVHDFGQWRRAFATHFWDVSGGPPGTDPIHYYRPLVTLSYLLNWVTAPNQAWWFHLTNVMIHAVNTWLVLLVGRRWLQSPRLGVACALLFALHPTRTEAVVWISGRPDPLMTTFVLLTLQLGYVGRQQGWRLPAALGALVCFVLALLSKEPALATPLLLCVDAAQARRQDRRWHVLVVGLTAALSATYLALRHWFLPLAGPPLSWTPGHAAVTITHYVERVIWPWPLTFFYELERLGPSGPVHSPLDLTAGSLLLLGAFCLLAYAARRDRSAFFLLLGSAAFLGPLLNFTYTGSKFTTSDRFLYLPLWLFALGLCRMFSAPLAGLLETKGARLVGAGVLSIYAALTGLRTVDFSSSLALWASELALDPQNPMALRARSRVWAGQGQRGRAIRDLELSLRNESLRYHTIITPDYDTDSYGHLIALRGQQLPDGAVGELAKLAADGVDRLAGRPRPARSPDLGIDWPLNAASAHWVAVRGEEILARNLVLITTRLELHEISSALLDAIPDERLHLAPNPPLVALGEAREERFERARRRVETMKGRATLMPKVVTREALVDVELRISSAEREFELASTATESGRHLARAKAFATLGAYARALAEVRLADQGHPDFLPLYVQLLVFARLEAPALDAAARSLGPERARLTLEAIRSQLPPELLAIPPL